ncbi:hypothetical protein ABG768_012491 [Culter alburnus]|uniref:RING-type domain-containing protein n=1 Tax=Culter alburnus TaxID=194366 RepID=A0AAW2AZ81_CULAL
MACPMHHAICSQCLAGTATTCPSCKRHFIGLVKRIIPRLIKHRVGGKPLLVGACSDTSISEEDKSSSQSLRLQCVRALQRLVLRLRDGSIMWSQCQLQSCRTHS